MNKWLFETTLYNIQHVYKEQENNHNGSNSDVIIDLPPTLIFSEAYQAIENLRDLLLSHQNVPNKIHSYVLLAEFL